MNVLTFTLKKTAFAEQRGYMMDENKNELIENEEVKQAEETAATENAAQETVALESAEETAEKNVVEEIETAAEDAQEESDSTFSIEKVDSQEALTEILSGETAEDTEEAEQEMKLAKYAADCESCATKVFFELSSKTCPIKTLPFSSF